MVEQIPRFTSIGAPYMLAGSRVVPVLCDRKRDRDEPGLRGPVVVDGVKEQCVGVERVMIRPPIRAGEKIGLLLADKDDVDER